ncbi:MAG: polyphosphate kinase 2 [Candidatus Nephthysia bennettiae]|uniref:ADP/GDP-polyphosphate phosphotransferase n=1 Tax=Candidatus Nephthysia bennettiae TaxID=3127016 RepID=A0A934K678_9BACT|nr:polyphosphate kinase 2 [Candidatus Dormibacteraeota bacterium]PZR95078.1 MAG: polyphosphate kinase 2 [Candidatus Dormibacteraeota bacterium]
MAKTNTKANVKTNAKANKKDGHKPVESAEVARLTRKEYNKELRLLQEQLLLLEEWVRHQGLRVVVLFEGRDTAGKGGMIKRITARLNPRFARVTALPAPTERERTQWYFQRYITHLPGAGEIVFFDRSWYNRAGVERVMGFCSQEEYDDFTRSCPQFERMLLGSGIILIKYWLSVSDEEQERRFQARLDDPSKRWKLSVMDLQARARWVDYSEAKDQMFAYTDIKEAPWHVTETDNKRTAHLNLMSHLLSLIPYQQVPHEEIKLPPRQKRAYKRPPKSTQGTPVPIRYEVE